MKRPYRKDYINTKTITQLIADLEIYINYLEEKLRIEEIKNKSYKKILDKKNKEILNMKK